MTDIEEKIKQLKEEWDIITKNISIPCVPYNAIDYPKILKEGWLDRIIVETEEEENL